LERFSRFHDLRHSFASALAKAGRPERQIQEWCGHSSPTVTRRYMRSFAREEPHDLEAVDAAFGAVGVP
jgi:integrase